MNQEQRKEHWRESLVGHLTVPKGDIFQTTTSTLGSILLGRTESYKAEEDKVMILIDQNIGIIIEDYIAFSQTKVEIEDGIVVAIL